MARALSKSLIVQRPSPPSWVSPRASAPQLPNQSVQAAGMRDRLPSGSTASNNGTPRRFRPLMMARRHPSKGCRLRMMTTEVGRSWEWVVCGVFVQLNSARAVDAKSSRRIADGRLLHVIKRWLTAPVVEVIDGRSVQTAEARRTKRGTPQGGVISPLLANCYFRRFLLAWHDHGHRDQLDAHVVNYADDFVICCRPGNAPAAMARMATLMTRLGLEVNAKKTRIARLPEEFIRFSRVYGRSLPRQKRAPVYRHSAVAEVSKEPARTYPPTDDAPVVCG